MWTDFGHVRESQIRPFFLATRSIGPASARSNTSGPTSTEMSGRCRPMSVKFGSGSAKLGPTRAASGPRWAEAKLGQVGRVRSDLARVRPHVARLRRYFVRHRPNLDLGPISPKFGPPGRRNDGHRATPIEQMPSMLGSISDVSGGATVTSEHLLSNIAKTLDLATFVSAPSRGAKAQLRRAGNLPPASHWRRWAGHAARLASREPEP